MSDKELNPMSALDIFSAHTETLEDAKQKSASESSNRVEVLRMSKEGTYKLRILPLAPVQNSDGTYTIERKGYEYGAKELVLEILVGKTKEGKPKFAYTNVCHLKDAMPQLEGADLIDLFVTVACEKYADDKKLCEALRANSFEGGLRYDSKRYMYVYDLNNKENGIMMFALTFPQYKELEERKLKLWEELRQEDRNAMCPISSPLGAYPVEITRKKENKKTSYSININARKPIPLEEAELVKLLSMPRLPEQLYRYTRYHLEATIEYLKQYEQNKNISVLDDPRIKDFIDKIKTLLPASDTSHFNPNKDKKDDQAGSSESGDMLETLDGLWQTLDKIKDTGKNDQCEEGQNLRSAILDFIEEYKLDVAYSRRSSNAQLLDLIEEAVKEQDDENPSDEAPEEAGEAQDDEPADEPEESGEEKTPERNDDTAEPAARPDRRATRTPRRHR